MPLLPLVFLWLSVVLLPRKKQILFNSLGSPDPKAAPTVDATNLACAVLSLPMATCVEIDNIFLEQSTAAPPAAACLPDHQRYSTILGATIAPYAALSGDSAAMSVSGSSDDSSEFIVVSSVTTDGSDNRKSDSDHPA